MKGPGKKGQPQDVSLALKQIIGAQKVLARCWQDVRYHLLGLKTLLIDEVLHSVSGNVP